LRGGARRAELAFVYRDTAEIERKLRGGARRPQLAFNYRHPAEIERQ
jgi:hypothetical protein